MKPKTPEQVANEVRVKIRYLSEQNPRIPISGIIDCVEKQIIAPYACSIGIRYLIKRKKFLNGLKQITRFREPYDRTFNEFEGKLAGMISSEGNNQASCIDPRLSEPYHALRAEVEELHFERVYAGKVSTRTDVARDYVPGSSILNRMKTTSSQN